MPTDYRTHAALRRAQDREYTRHLFRKLATLMRQIKRMPRLSSERGKLIKRARRTQDALAMLGAMPGRA